MIKCRFCDKEAEFDSPANLCDHHWSLWWYTGIYEGWNGPPPSMMDAKEKRYFNLVSNGTVVKLFDKGC